jgi:hypothetical protein
VRIVIQFLPWFLVTHEPISNSNPRWLRLFQSSGADIKRRRGLAAAS